MDVRGSAERQRDRLQTRLAADVETAAPRAQTPALKMLPDEQRSLPRGRHAGIDGDVGERERILGIAGSVPPDGRPAVRGECLVLARAGLREAPVARACSGERGARRADALGSDTAAAADDLRPLLAPGERQIGVVRLQAAGLVAPAGRREVSEVRIGAERQVGEVAQPRQHSGHMVRRDAVDQQRSDAELLEAARGAPEGIALRPAPMLPVDAAVSVCSDAGGNLPQHSGMPVASRLSTV